ncbi:MAG: hypothetical protein LQ350_007336 [Teloschistes chrysophthalmus]|nr:MAG: hypothetical protein LQ350_007336 [Niorma chrysophthalma]
MAHSLMTLPLELLRLILDDILHNGHLVDLALCCRWAYHLVLPCLYSHLSLNSFHLGPGGEEYFPYLEILTEQLLSNPTLACGVRRVSLRPASKDNGWLSAEEELPPVSKSLIKKAEQLIKHFEPERSKAWIQNVREGDQDAIAAVIFLLTPNLEVLDITQPCWNIRWLLHLMKRAALVRIGASLENLWLDFTDSLYDNYADEHVPGHISSLSSLKELKNLKNLKIGLWPLFEGTDKDISEVPGTSDAESDLRSLAAILPVSLENIYFGRTRGKLWLIVLALTKLLRSKASFVPNLKEVSIEIFEIDMDDKASWWSDLADLEILAANVSVKGPGSRPADRALMGA